jgi:hypothetical protein
VRCAESGLAVLPDKLPRARALAALRDVGMPLGDVAAVVDATDRAIEADCW